MATKYLRAQWWLFLGRSRSRREDYRGALTCYERVLRLFPNHPQALANAGNCFARQGLYEDAIKCYERALEERPDYSHLHAGLGLIYVNLQRYQESIDSFNRAFRMKPVLSQEPWYSVAFANALWDVGRREDALAAYNAAAENSPKDSRAQAALGWRLYETGKFKDAEIPLRTAINLDPDFGNPYLNLSFVLGEFGRYDESLAFAERFASLETENPVAHANVGWLLSETGRQREAVVAYKRSVELNPNFAEGHRELGRIHERLGEYQEAIDAEEKAISLEPDFLGYCVMGLALLQQGKHERSMYFSRKAIEQKPECHEAWNNLGEACLATGRFEEAVTCFERVLKLAPGIPETAELHLQIGTAQVKLGNSTAAQIQCEVLRAMGSEMANELQKAISSGRPGAM